MTETGLPSALPVALQRGLAFWVDANTNLVLGSSTTVAKWLDVREASTNAPYAYMRAEHDFNYYSNGWARARNPVRVVGNASENSLPMVDFGTFGATNTTAAQAYKGTTYMNGVQVDSGDRVPDALGHVFETMTASSLTAGNFFNGRNIDGYSGTFPHIGGGRIGECLVYTNVLTEAERLAIESYLQRKWKSGGQVGAHRVEACATLITAVGSGATNKVNGVSGEGRWRKTGAGAVSLVNELSLKYRPIQLEEGALVDNGLVRRPNRLFAIPDSGLVVRAETGRWDIVSTATTNAVVKTGAGELTVTGFPSSVTQIAIKGGLLRLTQALCDSERVEPVTVYNSSFEIFTNHDFHGQWSSANPEVWGFEPAGSGWTYTGNPTTLSSANAAGIYKPNTSALVWSNIRQPAPDGDWVALLKMAAKMSQPVTFSEGGYYTLSFMSAGRMRPWPSYCYHDFKVLFNGEQVGTVQTVDETWRRYTFRLPYAAAGVTNTLLFKGINSMNAQLGTPDDHTSFIDDVRVTKQAAVNAAGTPGVYRNVKVSLDACSKLALDFSGQVVLKELWYDGRLYSGTRDASNTAFLTGTGSLYVSPKGTMIRIY